MNFDRDFVLKTSECEPISPDLDKNDRHLFRGLTQENVEMDRRVREEHTRSVKRDDELLKEMHSFGMIECTVFDSRAKLARVHVEKTVAFSVPVESTSLNELKFISATVSGAFRAGEDLCLLPCEFTYTDGTVQSVSAIGTVQSNGKTFSLRLEYDTSGEDATLHINLAGAVVESGRLCAPTSTGTVVKVKMNLIDFYM